ncbi:hypothetical protein NM32_2221, partial [Neisseria meningitidis NM32]
MQQHIEKWQHLSREEQKILAEVWGLVQNDDQEVHYEMLKLNAPDEASGEFWFRMAETLSTLPPNRSLDLRMNGGRLATAVSILSVMIEDNPDIPSSYSTGWVSHQLTARHTESFAVKIIQPETVSAGPKAKCCPL